MSAILTPGNSETIRIVFQRINRLCQGLEIDEFPILNASAYSNFKYLCFFTGRFGVITSFLKGSVKYTVFIELKRLS